MDHNVDEVVMVRRLSNGEPDHPGGHVRIVDKETADAVDKVQIDAIEANVRNRAEIIPGAIEPPELPAAAPDAIRRVGTVARDVDAGVHTGIVAKGMPGVGMVEPGAKAEAGMTDISDPETGEMTPAGSDRNREPRGVRTEDLGDAGDLKDAGVMIEPIGHTADAKVRAGKAEKFRDNGGEK